MNQVVNKEDYTCTIKKLTEIVDFFLKRQERMIPCSIDGGFFLFQAMTNIVNNRPNICDEILQTLSDEGITSEYFSLCNWVCLNACTMDYHQDKDASYSMICVPYINYEKSPVYNDNEGSYAFSFC